jgi:hypothetical protein
MELPHARVQCSARSGPNCQGFWLMLLSRNVVYKQPMNNEAEQRDGMARILSSEYYRHSRCSPNSSALAPLCNKLCPQPHKSLPDISDVAAFAGKKLRKQLRKTCKSGKKGVRAFKEL